MKVQKTMLQTFDYELFLGRKSGSVDKCLIEPTNLLLNLFKKHKFTGAIFFVDTTYLFKLKQRSEQACIDDFKRVSEQLIAIISQGHYLYPHIHPHWLDAIYLKEINQWDLSNYSKYRFNLISEEEKNIVFDESIQVLKSIISQKFPDYKIDGYRAGGWCIQPFWEFKPFFEKHQIKFEFSVLTGHSNFTKAHYFDFTSAPKKEIYSFSDDVCVEDKKGVFKQFAISSVQLNKMASTKEKIYLKFLRYKGDKSFGDGIGLVLKSNEEKIKPTNKNESNSKTINERVSIELLNASKLVLYKKFLSENNYMHFISHPKMLSLHNLKAIDKFLHFASTKYVLNTDFKKIDYNH